MKTKLFYLFVGVFTLTMISCESESNSETDKNTASKQNAPVVNANPNLPGNSPCVSTTLLAGQRQNAGDFTVYFDADKVYVAYTTTGNWFIRKTHVYIGNCELIPVNRRGDPVPGHFPIAQVYPDGTQTAVYAMAKTELSKCFCISAHAEVYRTQNSQVVQIETAWAQGERFTQTSWGMFFSVCQDDCPL